LEIRKAVREMCKRKELC